MVAVTRRAGAAGGGWQRGRAFVQSQRGPRLSQTQCHIFILNSYDMLCILLFYNSEELRMNI